MRQFIFLLLTLWSLPFSWASPRRPYQPHHPNIGLNGSYPNSTEAINSGLTLKALGQLAAANTRAKLAVRGPEAKCNLKNVQVYREWRTISKHHRRQYVQALYCIYNKPNIYNSTEAPGARNFWDSFTATHIREGNFAHYTANFLTWHRYFTWLWNEALQDCGYHGPIPYWEWGLDVASPRDSPVFDGSDTSLGGDGEYIPDREIEELGPGVIRPPGTGGGCVYKGPFSESTDFEVHLGPGGGFNVPLEQKWFEYNPRCMKRDLNPWIAQNYLTFNRTTASILVPQDVEFFQAYMQGDTRYEAVPRRLQIHGGGHSSIGGDGDDFWTSPADPAFFLHHGQIDRVYTIWQMIGDKSRLETIAGTMTIVNNPPSRNMTLDDLLYLEPMGPNIPVRDALSTIDGPFCYMYE